MLQKYSTSFFDVIFCILLHRLKAPGFYINDYFLSREFEPRAFKMVKITVKKCKHFQQIQTSDLQSVCLGCYYSAILLNKCTSNTTYLIKANTVLLAQPAFIHLYHRRRMETDRSQGKQSSLLFGVKCLPTKMAYSVADELIQVGWASFTAKYFLFFKTEVVINVYIYDSSVVASWAFSPQGAGSNLLGIFKLY